MNLKVFLRPKAAQDIDNQALYIAQQSGIAIGHRFYDAIQTTLDLLASRPSLGAKTNFQALWLKDARFFPVKTFARYIVFYRPSPRGIDILRIVHGARDMENLF